MFDFIKNLFDPTKKQMQKAWQFVEEVNNLETEMSKLTDEQLKQVTNKLRKELGFKKTTAKRGYSALKADESKLQKEREKLFSKMPQVFAYVREAAKRVAKHRHFDVQLIAGYFLANNYVIEQYTGEGKTVSVLPALYLYALTERSVHLVTVNDYLARRDGEWAGRIFHQLGMSVGVVTPEKSYAYAPDEVILQKKEDIKDSLKEVDWSNYSTLRGYNLIEVSKKEAYDCDIVYGIHSEFGFDYLRDNMAPSVDKMVQRGLYYAVVDEADSILIDEARTPLIISSPSMQSNQLYVQFASIANMLEEGVHYTVDEKDRSVLLTEEGIKKVEQLLNVKNLWEDFRAAYHLENALRAKALFKKDRDYIVKNGQVLIVDQFSGRVLPGRRYSEGLHQAIEAKEKVEIKKESKTLATISYQNYFRLYKHLAGMTGTALTEAEEFNEIYGLSAIAIPTYKPVIRRDNPDIIYKTEQAKFNAVVEKIKELYGKKQPVLVGTASVENSEILSKMLKKEGVPHNVLNAKHHEKEAHIVAKAGQKGSVTVATNMAGRGTDIKLGEGVKELGGLFVIGTEKHEARRIDNQLRGRSGRLGDPGASQFFVSLEDDVMKRGMGGDIAKNLFGKLEGVFGNTANLDNTPIESKVITRMIETAQKRLENYHFDIRKHLVEYDSVLSQHRDIFYLLRYHIVVLLDELVKLHNKKYSELDNLYKSSNIVKTDWGKLLDYINNFQIVKPEMHDKKLYENHLLYYPTRIWILQKALKYIQAIISNYKQDDQQIDTKEGSLLKKHIKSLVTEDLYQRAINLVKIDNQSPSASHPNTIIKILTAALAIKYEKFKALSAFAERQVILGTLDSLWVEHLSAMQDLRQGISLMSYGGKNPLVEYKNEGFRMFNEFLGKANELIITRIFKVDYQEPIQQAQTVSISQSVAKALTKKATKSQKTRKQKDRDERRKKKPGRNDPCPCGSGKKYKKCCYPKYG